MTHKYHFYQKNLKKWVNFRPIFLYPEGKLRFYHIFLIETIKKEKRLKKPFSFFNIFMF